MIIKVYSFSSLSHQSYGNTIQLLWEWGNRQRKDLLAKSTPIITYLHNTFDCDKKDSENMKY